MSNSNLRETQLFELQMLSDITDLCDRNNIKYYLCCGTLLGAVRHKGFIPWDEDVDICMPANDYKRFLKIAQKEFGDKYFIQNLATDLYFRRIYTRVRANNTTIMIRDWEFKSKAHQGIWIDIFPIVDVGNSKLSLKKKSLILRTSLFMQNDEFIKYEYDKYKRMFGSVGIKLISLSKKIPIKIRQRLNMWLARRLIKQPKHKDALIISVMIKRRYPIEFIEGEPAYVEFEGKQFKTFPKYIEYLELLYGDYMALPPEEQRVGHRAIVLDTKKDYKEYQKNN